MSNYRITVASTYFFDVENSEEARTIALREVAAIAGATAMPVRAVITTARGTTVGMAHGNRSGGSSWFPGRQFPGSRRLGIVSEH